MTIQLNSDKTIKVTAALSRFVKSEVVRILERFADRLTRIEIHLSDVNNLKTGQPDKRCLVEARPAGEPPVTVSAVAATLDSSVASALGKMKRSLTTSFGRRGHSAASAKKAKSPQAGSTRKKAPAKKAPAKKASAPSTGTSVKKKATPKKAAAGEQPTSETTGRHKKKRIYQARRKPWPTRE